MKLNNCPACGSDKVQLRAYAIEVGCLVCFIEVRFQISKGTLDEVVSAVTAKWNALPRSLRWSRNIPTTPGLWLWKSAGCSESVLHLYNENRGLGFWNDDIFVLISNYDYNGNEFAGPIQVME